MKRRVAIAFLAFVSLLALGTVALLRTRWAGERICALAEAKVREATGLELELASCRIDPLGLEVSASAVRLGPEDAPLFSAEAVRVRLSPVQALGRRIEVAELGAVRPRVRLALPPPSPDRPRAACPPAALSRFQIHHLQVEDGSLDLALPGGERIQATRIDVRSETGTLPQRLRSLASVTRSSRVDVSLGPALVRAAGREIRVDHARVVGEVALDLSRLELYQADASGEGLGVTARGEVRDLCHPTLSVDVAAQAPLPAALALLGRREVPSSGSASLRVHLSGTTAAPRARGDLALSGARLAQFSPGDVRLAFRLAGTDLAIESLDVPFQGGGVHLRGNLRLGREPTLAAEVETRQVEFAELLERLGLEGSHVMMRLGSRAKVSGTIWPLDLRGEAGVDVQDFRVLDRSWKEWRAGGTTALDFRRARLDAGVRVTPEAVHVEGGRIRLAGETLGVSGELSLQDGFSLDLDGGVDLGELRHLGSVPWAGTVAVSGTIRAPTYGSPRIEGSARAAGFRFLDLDLGNLAATVAYERLVLQIDDLDGRTGGSRYGGEVALDLGRAPAFVASARLSASGRLRDLLDAVAPRISSARRLRDLLDAQVNAEAAATGPVTELDVGFEGRLGPGAFLGRPFDSGSVAGRIVRSRRAVFERAELRRGQGVVRAAGEIGLEPPSPWDLEISFGGMALGDLRLPGGPWAGTASGSATLRGSADDPALRFAASGEGVAVGGVPLGSVQVGGNVFGDRLAITGTTPGVRFSGAARLAEGRPFEAKADLDLDDIARFIPGGPPAGLRAQVKGEAAAEGRLDDLADTRARLHLTRLRGGYADFRVENAEPVTIAIDRGRVDVASFTLRGINTEFALSGHRAADGRLDLGASGSLDLRLLGGLVPSVARTRGQLTLDAHVTGTAAEPLLVGSGHLRDAGFRVKDLPLEFASMTGDLAFSQNRVLFDDLGATLNGGRAVLRGEVELSRFVPSRVQAEAELDTVPVAIPAYIPSWVSGRLTAFGTPEALTLSGRLHVLRARYTEKVDLEKSMLEFRRRTSAQRGYEKPGDWLRFDIQLLVDGDVRVENDLVNGGVRGEITVTGTLGAMGLLGSLDMAPGSRVMFRGNDFSLSHAVMDFTERYRIRAGLDVHGDAQVSDYQVFMHLFGPLDDPKLQLTSSPPLSQQDIITLLSLGFTPRDTAARSNVGGAATAAAAQALFSVSGLDDQLKRFLPREGLFKDLAVRITSGYSEITGQVEPRAEVESRVWSDRLRLRFQAPLSGVARGQRAQAELKLGSHSSLQGQWDTENPSVGSDLGVDLKLRWEWSD